VETVLKFIIHRKISILPIPAYQNMSVNIDYNESVESAK